MHGDVRVDDYFWMNDRNNPDVIAWLEQENAHTREVMAPLAALEQTLYAEMRGRIPEQDQSAPYRDGDYWYYHRFEEGHEYPIYCRRHRMPGAPEEILLDANRLAAGADYFSLQNFAVSPDHRKAAFGIDTQGRRFYTIFFKDLARGELLPDRIENATSNFEWANDSNTLFYTSQDPETLRWNRIYRHTHGISGDLLVFEECDDTCWLWLEKSLSSQFLFLVSAATVATEVRYLPASSPQCVPRLFLPRDGEHEYFVTDGGDRFFILTNDNATNFRVMEAPLDDTSRDRWRELVPHRDDVLIEGLDVFQDYIALATLTQGIVGIEVLNRHTGEIQCIDFDEEVFTAFSVDNYQYDSEWFRYSYESMTTPESTYDFNLRTRERRLIREEVVLGGFNRHN